jgi:carboxylate-amine ligase
MEHHFTGPPYTLGVEEELMIVDARSMELVSAVEEMIEAVPGETEGQVKPELMQSVLEISTDVCRNASEAAGQLEDLRRRVRETAERRGLTIGSAGTHPFAHWEDQLIVDRDRYREVVDALRFVARQELLFGLHVHVGIDDPEKAIHVANGMRVHLPILLALSANSPFWRGAPTGLMSSRTPLFPGLRTGPTTVRGSSSWWARARSPTTPTCGGTCAPTPTSAPSRCAAATLRPGSTTRSRWRR